MWPVSPTFIAALKAPVATPRARMDVLDPDLRVVHQFHDEGVEDTSDNLLVDGSVDLDITRPILRSFTATILNSDGLFSPGSDWAGIFYVNRLIRIWRGIEYGTTAEMVPVGTFMIDHADITVERNMSLIVLSGSDRFKVFTKGRFASPRTWAKGSDLAAVITTIASDSGITDIALDDFPSRASNAKTLNSDLHVEPGDVKSDVLLKLATDYGFELSFDPLGRLTTRDFKKPGDSQPVWLYDTADNRMMLTIRSSYSDDDLYNHVIVIGSGGTTSVVSSLKDTDPLSPTNISKIGDRTYVYESADISTQAAADAACTKLFYGRSMTSEEISLDAICNPALDGNDVVTVREKDLSKLDSSYRIRGLSTPLSSSRQQLRLQRSIDLATT